VDVRDIVPLIFWPWLIISVVILIRRSISKRTGLTDDAAGSEPLPPLTSPLPSGPAPSTTGTPTGGIRAPEPVPGPAPDLVVPEGSSIFDAPSDLPPTAPRTPIAEMVRGIQLPCDLTPLVGAERPIGARESAAFVTRSHDATSVGRAMGEELRRLDYELTTRHATEVVATRGDDWLLVAVHADAGTVERGDRPAFPGAGPGSVVVELWTE
jgi:hypothetical protein